MKKNQIIPSSTQCIDVLCNVDAETEQSMECNIEVDEMIQRHQRHDFICQHTHINNNTCAHVQTQTEWLDLLCFAFVLLSSESKLTIHVAFWIDLHCNYGNMDVNAHIHTHAKQTPTTLIANLGHYRSIISHTHRQTHSSNCLVFTHKDPNEQASFCGEPRSSESILFQFCNLDRTKTTFCLVCFCHSSASLISKQAKVAGEDKDIRARQTRSQITAS